MLRKTLEMLALTLPLIVGSSSPAYTQQPSPYTTHSRPPVYAQASEDLSTRLLREADELAKKNPVSAIPFYRTIINKGGTRKEEAIESLLNIYRSITDEMYSDSEKYNPKFIKDAFKFYSEAENSSIHRAKAKLFSGISSSRSQTPQDYDNAIKKLKEAYDIGDDEVKAEAALNLAFVYLNYSYGLRDNGRIVKRYSLFDAKKYFELVIDLAPNSELAQKARNILERVSF